MAWMIAASSLRSAYTLSISFLVSLCPKRQARPRVKMALNNSFPLFTQPTDFNFFSMFASLYFNCWLLASRAFLRFSISVSSSVLQAATAFCNAVRAPIILSQFLIDSSRPLICYLMAWPQILASVVAFKSFLASFLFLRPSVLMVLFVSFSVVSAIRLTSWTMVERSNW